MHKRLLSLLIVMFAVLMPTKLWAQEPYAVLTGDTISGMTLTFYYDGNKLAYKDAMSVGPFSADNDRGWHEVQYLIKNVVFDQSFANCDMLTSTTYWFKDFNNLTSIMGLENLKTDNVTDMVQMFKGCSSLTSLDLSTFNTEKVIDMTWMFYECSGLTSLNVSKFNTANVTRTCGMFLGCSGLTSLDVTGFNTQKVTDMSGMFENCFGLTSLDVTGFNTENVTSMGGIFSGCSGLTSLDLSSFDIQSVKYTSHMFSSCSGLKSLDLSGFNTEKVTDMSGMFENCSGLKSLDLSGFNTENVTSMSLMFRGCSGLTSLSLGGINTVNVINMYCMFSGCSALTSLDVTGFNTQNVTHMSDMFRDCSSLTSLDVTGFNTEKVTNMSGMFENCSMLTSLDVTGFNTQNVTSMNDMFSTCSSLTSLDLSVFQTDNVTDMRWMFRGCSSLTTIYAGNEWTTAEVTYGSYLFTGCTNLVGGKGTIYDANHTDYTYARIDGGPNSETLGYFTDKNASEEIAAPTFRFEGDSLFIETATKDASIFYQMADLPNMDEATVQKISESLTVTADAQQSIYYEQPIELKKSVVLKAIAAGATNSEISTLVYDYDAWQKLLEALDYGMDVSGRASDNSNVPDEMKEQLIHMLEEGKWVYYERMWDHNAVDNLTNEIMQLAHQIDEMMTVVTEPEPYAVLSDNNTVLTFYYDDQKTTRNGMSVGPFHYWTDNSWYEFRKNIINVIFNESFAACDTIRSTAYWFYECNNLTSIIGIENLKTDNATSMTSMFYYCTNLESIDVSGFKTSNVTSFGGMFQSCSKLQSIDVSGFDTGNSVFLNQMFRDCSNLTNIDVSGFNTENVQYMFGMFSGCSTLTSIDVRGFETKNVKDIYSMFSNCYSLTSIDVSGFNTVNVTSLNSMFSRCHKLTNIDVSGFNTEKVTDMSGMFLHCAKIDSLDLSHFNTSNVIDMNSMFASCSSLRSIDVSSFNTAKVTNMSYMFSSCEELLNLDLSNFNTANVTSMDAMFAGCSKLINLDLSKFNTENVSNMEWMFSGCSSLKTLDVSSFNTSNVTTMYCMFRDCSSLAILDLSSFNTPNVIITDVMFASCTSLKTIYGSNWDMSKVTGGSDMFANCLSLIGGAGTVYTYTAQDQTYAHIDGGENNPGYFTDKNAPVISDDIIQFADANVKAICVQNWDTNGDGELSKAEAANVISLDNAFTGNKDITSFDEFQYFVGVIALGSREFGGCYNLSSIILPPNLKSLEAESLNGNKIDELTIPASVTSIEPSALYATYKNIFVEEGNAYFSSIDGVLFNKDITKIVTYPERKEAESYEIPNTVVTIGRCAFYSSELKSVTIPYGVNTIEGSAFRYCGNLESIDIPGSVETIGYDNFEFANSLTTATIPSSVKSIDTGVFASCQNLQEIIVDTNNQYYTSVDGVLYTKDKTHLVTYPAGKPDENVVIPNYVTSIGQCGVYGCNNIKSVVIPRRVESIGWFAFVNCANLNSVTTHRKKPLELTKTFDDRAQQNGTLYVPYGTKELYQAADEWNGFQNIVELDPSAIISLVNNGDMEGEDNGNFFVRTNYSSGNEEPVQAAISNGVGVNGSRGIKVEATSKLAVSWDNQFWVRLNQPISEGTLYRVSFDYRADKEAMIGAEAHEEPTAYINWGFFGNDLSFTDSWSHFEFEGTMSSLNSKDELPFQSLTFSFNNNFEDANNYYFDNFNFEVMMENQCPKPTFKQKGNEISILSPFNAKIYYTLDGSTPTTSSQVYAGSLKLTENAEINAIAVVEGYEASPVATCKFVHPQFDSNGVLAVTGRTRLSDALEAVGGREEVAKTITAILWEGNYAVYNRELQSLDNPNMLIYVNDESLAPQNRDNVIIGDFAKNIVLTDVSEGNGNFYCPRTFKAEMVSYTHEYRQQTEIGVSRGWETIALPFTVQTIMHEKNGLIAPFGNTASSKHFWLREMTPQGLGQATVISANMPYLISMPNNSVAYPAEFNLNGRVTFSSQDVDVVVTDIFPAYMQSEGGGMLMFAPCFKTLEPHQDAYALNVGEQRGHYLEGSVFESNYRAIRPFEAFTIHEGNSPAPQFIPVSDMNVGITDIGASLVNSEEANSEKWYDLNGRRLQQKPTQKGVYILNGKKTVVK